MDTENKQDGAEPCPASTGSVTGEPAAWAVVCGDCVDSTFTDRDKAVEWAGRLIPPAHIVALYRSPTLTDAERAAIEYAWRVMKGPSSRHSTALRGLLERLS